MFDYFDTSKTKDIVIWKPSCWPDMQMFNISPKVWLCAIRNTTAWICMHIIWTKTSRSEMDDYRLSPDFMFFDNSVMIKTKYQHPSFWVSKMPMNLAFFKKSIKKALSQFENFSDMKRIDGIYIKLDLIVPKTFKSKYLTLNSADLAIFRPKRLAVPVLLTSWYHQTQRVSLAIWMHFRCSKALQWSGWTFQHFQYCQHWSHWNTKILVAYLCVYQFIVSSSYAAMLSEIDQPLMLIMPVATQHSDPSACNTNMEPFTCIGNHISTRH